MLLSHTMSRIKSASNGIFSIDRFRKILISLLDFYGKAMPSDIHIKDCVVFLDCEI